MPYVDSSRATVLLSSTRPMTNEDTSTDRLVWTPPTLTVIDLADSTKTGAFNADDETCLPSSSRTGDTQNNCAS